MKKKMIAIMMFAIFVVPVFAADKVADVPNTVQIESPKVNALADCIMKLQPKQTPYVAKYIAYNIVKECEIKKLDPDLISAQMYVESEFKTTAKSDKGAIGLLQVRYSTWKAEPELKDNGVNHIDKLYWIDMNIKCATDIFAKYYEESGKSISATLYRYYTGDSKLSKRPWEIEYINKIMYYYFKIKEHQLQGSPLATEEDDVPPVIQKSVAPAKR